MTGQGNVRLTSQGAAQFLPSHGQARLRDMPHEIRRAGFSNLDDFCVLTGLARHTVYGWSSHHPVQLPPRLQ
jgi:hypothetical protein